MSNRNVCKGSKKPSGDGVGYNINNDNHTKEEDMPTNALQDLGDNARLHAADPILERRSDSYGLVRVYPPATDPSTWANHSWLLTTEYAEGKNPPGMAVKLKANAVSECFERPHFILDFHKFVETA